MNNVKFVSYYTPNGIYSQLKDDLIKSLQKYSLNYSVELYEDAGSWVKNCANKSKFILKHLEQSNINDCIVWIDSDAQVVKYPDLFLFGEQEFMIRGEPGGKSKVPAGRERIHLPINWPQNIAPCWFNSGTIFMRVCQNSINLCKSWITLQEQNATHWDQWTLQQAWCDIQPKTEFLPQSYCQIDRLHGRQGAVVLHRLASVEQRVNRK